MTKEEKIYIYIYLFIYVERERERGTRECGEREGVGQVGLEREERQGEG